MEMHQIRYFLAVAATLNFTRAAANCNVTQPALTRAIQKLEEGIGGLLLRREPGRVRLTDLGRLVRPHFEHILGQSEAVRSTARSFLTLESAPLRIGIMCTIGPLRFIGFLAEFGGNNPGVGVSLVEAVPRRLSDLLLRGELDAAVAAQPEPFDDKVRIAPLYSERFVVAFAAGHRFQERNAVALADLAGEAYLSRINCEYQGYIDQHLDSRKIVVREVYRSEREDWIQTLVAAGSGVALMPEFTPLVPGVLTRPAIEPEIMREVSLLTVAGRRHSPALAAFVRGLAGWRRAES